MVTADYFVGAFFGKKFFQPQTKMKIA